MYYYVGARQHFMGLLVQLNQSRFSSIISFAFFIWWIKKFNLGLDYKSIWDSILVEFFTFLRLAYKSIRNVLAKSTSSMKDDPHGKQLGNLYFRNLRDFFYIFLLVGSNLGGIPKISFLGKMSEKQYMEEKERMSVLIMTSFAYEHHHWWRTQARMANILLRFDPTRRNM